MVLVDIARFAVVVNGCLRGEIESLLTVLRASLAKANDDIWPIRPARFTPIEHGRFLENQTTRLPVVGPLTLANDSKFGPGLQELDISTQCTLCRSRFSLQISFHSVLFFSVLLCLLPQLPTFSLRIGVFHAPRLNLPLRAVVSDLCLVLLVLYSVKP